MKKLLQASLILIIFAISIIIFQVSCTKKGDAQTNILTKDQILVQKTWKVDQLHHVIACQYSSYISGGANTTGISYDKLRFTFNVDGSGTHIDQFSTSHPLTWQFTTTDKRTLQVTIAGSNPYIWQMVEIAGNYLHASVNLVIGGDTNNIETFQL